MKKIIIQLIAIMLLAMPVLAVPENITIGPYQVSFDAGKELQEWNVTEKESETYSGESYVAYAACNNARHEAASVCIYVTRFSLPVEETKAASLRVKERADLLKQYMGEEGYSCNIYARTIDGYEGFVARCCCPEVYFSVWIMGNTTVKFWSTHPWDEGMLQLLKTIHVEKIGEPLP